MLQVIDPRRALTDPAGGPARLLRRDAVIRLVQMVRGGSRTGAARYLGIPPGTLESTALRIRTWQKEPGNADAYRQIAEIAIYEGRSGAASAD
ncbi:hypothetical protein [Streptomyces virginiae]|uniref:hypothetical protein n=1 Tax=Streptomyces virginiae TaxID=1961 RepID=UPI0034206E60